MNSELIDKAFLKSDLVSCIDYDVLNYKECLNKFVELIKQAIYDEVKEELLPDELVDIEPHSLSRQYLKGCNEGLADALYIIKNFGVIQDDEYDDHFL